MPKKNFAYETYKKVEASSNFATHKDKKRYAEALLARTKKHELPFLRRHLKEVSSALEIGSGSGRILHAMREVGLVEKAQGIEISPSRIAFAKEWVRMSNITHVTHQVGDVLKRGTIKGTFDAILCMTSIYPFFNMLEKRGLRKVLRTVHSHLNPGGYLVLESVTFAKEIAHCRLDGGITRVWEEYGKRDPFRFNLIEYRWEEKKRHLTALSYNVMRDRLFVDGPSVKKWHMQTGESLRRELSKAGFKKIQFFGDFDSRSYTEERSPRCIVVARV